MLDLSKYRLVDLSPKVVAGVERLNGEIVEGVPDPLGVGITLKEMIFEGGDNTKFTMGNTSGHTGSHAEGGRGHIDHWKGTPDDMMSLWEYPLDAFYGPAAVCDMSSLKPVEEDGKLRSQRITPEHLSNVEKGDIALVWSSITDRATAPYIAGDTAKWLAEKKIKMLAVQQPGILWDTAHDAPQPNNSPSHRAMLGNNLAVTYPLANMEQLKKDRVFYMGLPMRIENLEGTWVRAVAFEDP